MEASEQHLKPQLSHRGLMAVGAVMAFALVIIVAAGTWMYLDLRKHERELRGLLNPTAQQFKDQLQQGLKRCLQEPQCRKLFPQLTIHHNRKTHQSTVVPISPHARHTIVASTDVPRRQGATPTRPVRRTPPHRRQPPRTVPPPSHHPRPTPPSPSGPPPSPPPKPSPPVSVTAPVPLNVCTQLVQLNNCPINPQVP